MGEAASSWSCSKRGTSSACSLWSTLYTGDHGSLGRLGQALVMRQPACAFERISCRMCSRSSHLESGTLFPLSLYLAVLVPGVWVLLMSTKFGFFGRRLSSWVQCLVQQWIRVLRQFSGGFGRTYTSIAILAQVASITWPRFSVGLGLVSVVLDPRLQGTELCNSANLLKSLIGMSLLDRVAVSGPPSVLDLLASMTPSPAVHLWMVFGIILCALACRVDCACIDDA